VKISPHIFRDRSEREHEEPLHQPAASFVGAAETRGPTLLLGQTAF
jgi:hypothetical protein